MAALGTPAPTPASGDPAPGGVRPLAALVFETMLEGVIVRDRDLQLIDCNPAAERILGLTREQLAGQTPADPRWRAVREDGSPWPAEDFPTALALSTGQAVSNQVMGIDVAGGRRVWVKISAVPIVEAPGAAPRGVITTFSDITAQVAAAQRAEAATREAREATTRLAYVLEGSADAYWDYDAATKTMYCSPRLAGMLGRVPSAIPPTIGGLWPLVHPDDLPALQRAIEERLARGDGPFFSEHRLRHADGSWVWVAYRGRVVERDASGRPLRFAGLVTDITARKQHEALLAERDARLRAFLDSPAVGVIIAAPDAKLVEVNEHACELLGYSRDELRRMTWREVTHPDDRQSDVEHYRRLVAGETEHYSLEKRYLRKNGAALWCLLSVSCVRNPDRSVRWALAIINDISERKEIEGELREREARLERLVGELREALESVKTLSGLIPICMYCKNIRDDEGYWQRLERFIGSRADVRFTHGVCPTCEQQRMLDE